MKQKIFFTSIISMLVVMPAIANPSHTDTFPSDGYMQEDYKYTNAATFENTGVYDGSVDAIAEFEYRIGAGEYLPAGADETVDCPAGSFCPGIDGNVQYNQSSAQGIQTCPTGYASSAAGASSDTECYTACTLANANITHATAVTGNDYYGNGTDTCEPTACENGWHIKEGFNLLDIVTWTKKYIRCGSINAGGIFYENTRNSAEKKGQEYYNITTNNTFAVEMQDDIGMFFGISSCSSTPESTSNTIETINNDQGQTGAIHCWCKLTGYKPVGGDLKNLSSYWGYGKRFYKSNQPTAEAQCEAGCANYCATTVVGNTWTDGELVKLINTLPVDPAVCEANTITINWSDASQTDIDANNAGTATYGEDVRTPVSAIPVKGKTFRGWRFSKPESVSVESEGD